MKASLTIAASVLLLLGCAKIEGEYTGKLTDSSTITKGARPIGAPESKTDTTFKIVPEGDKLSTVLKGCKVMLERTKKRGEADVIPGQTCRFSALGYEGTANVTGTLTREGRWLNAVFALKPTEAELDGNLTVTFSGTAL